MPTLKRMVSVTGTAATLKAALQAASWTGPMTFKALSYKTPGQDYSSPNDQNVSVGDSSLVTLQDGDIIGPGLVFAEPSLTGPSFYDAAQIKIIAASGTQRILVTGVTT
jgi:hypothetical protein